MDSAEFREFGRRTIEWIAEYKENIKKYPVISEAPPGFLADVLPGTIILNLEMCSVEVPEDRSSTLTINTN